MATDDTCPTVALVLGAAVWAGGAPSPTLRRRALCGAALVLNGRADRLIGCGGVGLHPPAEAEVIAQLCRDAGVPEARIGREAASRSTWDNIALARPMLDALGARRVVIVTDWYHAPRAVLIARVLGLRATAACPPLRGARARVQVKGALREIGALGVLVVRLIAGRR